MGKLTNGTPCDVSRYSYVPTYILHTYYLSRYVYLLRCMLSPKVESQNFPPTFSKRCCLNQLIFNLYLSTLFGLVWDWGEVVGKPGRIHLNWLASKLVSRWLDFPLVFSSCISEWLFSRSNQQHNAKMPFWEWEQLIILHQWIQKDDMMTKAHKKYWRCNQE